MPDRLDTGALPVTEPHPSPIFDTGPHPDPLAALGGLVHGLGVSGVQLAATLDRITAAPPPPSRAVRRRPASAEHDHLARSE